MKILIAGETPFIEEIGQLCLAAGHDTTLYLVEDFYSAVESGSFMPVEGSVDVLIELHNESADAKQELLLGLGQVLPPRALVLASALATSATQAAAWVPNPQRVVGFGVVPPLGPAGLVELAPALQTNDANLARAAAFWKGLGCDTVIVADGPGLVRARVVCCLINEATSALMEGVATAEDIDKAMKLGTNYPMGPLAWADLLGLDMVLGVMNGLFAEWGEDRYRPTPLLRRMVAAGYLGRKSGQGFYVYPAGAGNKA
ncbi:MAG: 3-hydroxybutyryl-CoA dehydrogenase [Pseudomonadales bacterium]|nr:3-hydroxybutyryl-CoA dehydrogenase [Ardenticatenaceae bacterium]MCP5190361.1 3-hydroxybutyryl-CoA dehydrogenase [Pseudomonadales bacterium]